MRKLLISSSALAMALASSILATAPGLSHAARIVDGPEVYWRFSLWGQRRSFTEGIEYVSKHVGERTGGKFTIEIFYEQRLSKSRENLDGVSSGAFEGAIICAVFHPDRNKPLNVLDLPFLPLDNLDVMRMVHDAVYSHPAVVELFDRWNAFLYMSAIVPQFEFMGQGEAPKGIAEFKGRKVSAFGGQTAALEKLGATTTVLVGSEIRPALDGGAIDTVSFPYSYAFSAYKIDEISSWVTTNMMFGTVNCPIVFNRNAYDALPMQYKQLLWDLTLGAYTAMKRSYKEQNVVNEEKWKKSGTLRMVEFPASEMKQFRRIAGKPIWDAWVDENEGEIPAQQLLDLVMDTANRLRLCQ